MKLYNWILSALFLLIFALVLAAVTADHLLTALGSTARSLLA